MIDKTTTQSAFKDNPDFETTDWPLIVEMMDEALNGECEELKDENYDPSQDFALDASVRWARMIMRDLAKYREMADGYKHLYGCVEASQSKFEFKKIQDDLAFFRDLYIHEKEANQKLREELTLATSDRHKETMEESE